MTRHRVAIVVPTLDAGAGVDELLDALDRQEGAFHVDVIAIDSGSRDGTPDRLRRRGATVLEVLPGEFNHGETRNVALAHATGEFAILIVQDAVPASSTWLAALLQPLLDDPGVAGSFARQVPAPHATQLTAHYLSQWVAAQPLPRTVGPLSRAAFDAMPPRERHAVCAFDNVCACVRLQVWRSHPFRRVPIAEDLEWALEVLLAGYKLAYVPEAAVRHSHERPVMYELQRTYLVHQRLQALFGLSTIPSVPALLHAIALTMPAHARLASMEAADRRRAWLRGAALAVALPLGQYLGARSAREGRALLRTGRV
jgi:rhamnosyltransferase